MLDNKKMNEIERKPLYKVGDNVRIVKYGHLLWSVKGEGIGGLPVYKEEDGFVYIDINADIVGKTGIIDDVCVTQGIPKYSIIGIGSWYQEGQMELVKPCIIEMISIYVKSINDYLSKILTK